MCRYKAKQLMQGRDSVSLNCIDRPIVAMARVCKPQTCLGRVKMFV